MGTAPNTSATPSAYCRRCSYALAGLPNQHQCPECGRAFDLSNPKTFRRRPRRGWWRIARWVVYPLILLVLALGGGVGWVWWQWKREQPVIAWINARPHPWGWGVSTKPLGPPWLGRASGRWAYLLERADGAAFASAQPVRPQDPPLSRLRGLETLGIDGPGAGDDLMGEVGQLSQLTDLRLWNTSITDRGLARLAGCRKLATLVLFGSRVGDTGLAPLAGHPELTGLYLNNTPVDDRSLPVLKALGKLRVLNLTGTKITPAGVAELQKALPNCRIIGPDGIEVRP